MDKNKEALTLDEHLKKRTRTNIKRELQKSENSLLIILNGIKAIGDKKNHEEEFKTLFEALQVIRELQTIYEA